MPRRKDNLGANDTTLRIERSLHTALVQICDSKNESLVNLIRGVVRPIIEAENDKLAFYFTVVKNHKTSTGWGDGSTFTDPLTALTTMSGDSLVVTRGPVLSDGRVFIHRRVGRHPIYRWWRALLGKMRTDLIATLPHRFDLLMSLEELFRERGMLWAFSYNGAIFKRLVKPEHYPLEEPLLRLLQAADLWFEAPLYGIPIAEFLRLTRESLRIMRLSDPKIAEFSRKALLDTLRLDDRRPGTTTGQPPR